MVDQLPEEQVCFRTRKTILEILKDRGYEIDDGDIDQTFEQFKLNLTSKPSMNFIAKRVVPDAGEPEDVQEADLKMEPIFVVFAIDVDKIGRETINKVITTMEQYTKLNEEDKTITEFLNAILIVKGGITPIAKKYLEQCEPFMIETFMQEELLVNITHHESL